MVFSGKRVLIAIAVIIVPFSLIVMLGGGETPSTNQQPDFMSMAQARFANIKSVSPELKDIQCSADCTTVYFDYMTLPGDFDFVMRGNASTFSKFRSERLGPGTVTVVALKDGKTIRSCTADVGIVTGCK